MSLSFMSVCSGIDAPAAAWLPLGWRRVAVAEIEPFCCALLKHYDPEVKNLGDILQIDGREWRGLVDVLVGGTPCQDLSVAGKRAGLAGERSGLFFRFVEIAEEAKPDWVVFENVPGLLSSDGGNDFQAVLDSFEAAGYVLDAEILDAQYFGLAQRRWRVFIVCHRVDSLLKQRTSTSSLITLQLLAELSLGILAAASEVSHVEPESWASSRDRAADSLLRRIRLFGLQRESASMMLRNVLGEECQKCPAAPKNSDLDPGVSVEDTSHTKAARSSGTQKKAAAAPESSSIGSLQNFPLEDLLALAISFTTSTLTREITHPETFTCSQVALLTATRIIRLNPSCPSFLVAASSSLTVLLECIDYARRAVSSLFTEVEWNERWFHFLGEAIPAEAALRCIRDRAYAEQVLPFTESLRRDSAPSREAREGVTGTLSARTSGGGGLGTDFDLGGGLIANALNAKGGSGRMDGESDTFVTAPLTGNPYADNESRESLLVTHSLRADGLDASEDGTGRGTPLIAVPILEAGARTGKSTDDPRAGIGIGEPGDPMYTLQSGKQHAIGFSCKDSGLDAGEVAPTLRAMPHDGSHANGGGQVAVAFDTTQITSAANRSNPKPGDPCHPLAAGAHPPAAAYGLAIRGREGVPQIELGDEVANAILTPNGGRGGIGVGATLSGMAVRRLTPRECERLQGFPDDYTLIPHRGKPAADGSRYRTLGNSMAVPVIRWLGERIQAANIGLSRGQSGRALDEQKRRQSAQESDGPVRDRLEI